MVKEEIKFKSNNVFEGMPSVSAVIRAIENKTSDRRILCVYADKAKVRSRAKELSFLRIKAESLGFPIEYTDSETISDMCIGNTHGGIIAECSPRSFLTLEAAEIALNGVYFLFEGMEDPYNFGNAVRSVYASGADGLILGERNWLGAAGTVARASAGTSELLPTYISDTATAINIFKTVGYKIICAGIRDSESLFDAELSRPLLVVLGGEKRGISRTALDLADKIVRIDYGTRFNGSLSSSAAASVIAFEILRNNKK